MREADQILVKLPGDTTKSTPLAPLVGKLVQVSSTDVKPELLQDYDFGLSFPNSVKVARVAEYCQWTESYTDDEVRFTDGDGNERTETVRRYYYYKGWQSSPVPSLLFDQPAAHHNPQRDPFPRYSKVTPSARFGDFAVSSEVLSKAGPSKLKRDYTPADLKAGFATSPASGSSNPVNRFTYIGNGYFYSAYTPSTAESLFRLAGTWLEGSILDFQIGDLFSACTAGDIRISFDVVHISPKGATVIGQLLNTRGDIGLYTTSRGYKIGLFAQDASTPAREILRRELIATRWYLLGARVVVLIWAFYLLSASSGLSSRRHANGPRDLRGYVMWALQSFGVATASVSVLNLVLWRSASSGMFLGVAALLYWLGRPDGYQNVDRATRWALLQVDLLFRRLSRPASKPKTA
ncbi:hypothetical protein HDU96_006544 [Phlyctochytrium bullatum]|nr:hypothetical protein HDU96_006544 [Phlyctochytrium bullatum]